MTRELKLRKIGNSIGVILPKEALAHMKVEEGDTIAVSEGPAGTLNLAPAQSEVARQMAVAQDIMKRYRNTLRELAK